MRFYAFMYFLHLVPTFPPMTSQRSITDDPALSTFVSLVDDDLFSTAVYSLCRLVESMVASIPTKVFHMKIFWRRFDYSVVIVLLVTSIQDWVFVRSAPGSWGRGERESLE